MRWRKHALFAALALVSIAPMLFNDLGGDILTHYVMADCFLTQLWQGDTYPRWCFAANSGLGAPFFMFYSPLPYYALAPVFPLGLSMYWLLAIGFFMASYLAAMCCHAWLKDIAAPRFAMLGTALFLLMPYRMEAFASRAAYTEWWQMALAPLLFLYTRRVVRGEKGAILLGALIGVSFLCHVSCTLITILACGGYVLLMTGKTWQPKLRFGASVAAGGALAAFFLLPGAYYMQFVHEEGMNQPLRAYPNNFPSMRVIEAMHLFPVGLMIVLMAAAAVLVVCFMLWRKNKLPPAQGLEVRAWCVIALAGVFLCFPVSAPVYALLWKLQPIVFPWRMQTVPMIATVFLATVAMQHFWSRRKTFRSDLGLLYAFLLFGAFFQIDIYDQKGNAALAAQTLDSDFDIAPQYQPRWADAEHYNVDSMVKRYKERETLPKVTGGEAKIIRWGWAGIELQTDAAKPMTLTLDHLYFPVWAANVPIRPEEGSGRMLVDVPAGKQDVVLREDVANGNLALVHGSELLSLITAVGMALLWSRKRTV